MLTTRKRVQQIDLDASPESVYLALITPSKIRGWWSASRASVVAKLDGAWSAAWGDREDNPDYVTTF